MSDPEQAGVRWVGREFRTTTDGIAELFRKHKLASHALRDYIASGFDELQRDSLRSARSSAIQPVLKALRPLPFKWAAAEKEAKAQANSLSSRSTGARGRRIAFEIRTIVLPLLEAYRDPRYFFVTIAPRICPADFDEKDLLDSESSTLGLTLQRWGIAALLNPTVARAFASPTAEIDLILALTKQRPWFKGPGRPRGTGKGSKGSSIEWGARRDYFNAIAIALNGDRRMTRAEAQRCAALLGREGMTELINMREAKFLTTRVVNREAYRRTAERFQTSVPTLKRGFQRHRNSTPVSMSS